VSLNLLAVLGDVVWIVAMSMMASASRAAWRRIPADAKLPMQWGLNRKPTWRARRGPAFTVMIAVPLAFGLVLSAFARDPAMTPDRQLLALLVRMATAPVFVLVHMAWMRAALRTLEAEGSLKP